MIDNAYVCYFDVLGFTSRFFSGDLLARYDKLIEMMRNIEDPGATLFLMSDSIVVVSREFESFLSIAQDFYTWGILNDFWLRGAITRGSVTDYQGLTIMERNRIILPFLGEGYLKAYTLETTLNISGVVIDQAFFNPDAENPGFTKGLDYVEYEEYVPKRGYEGKKYLLLPKKHSLRQVVDTLYFEEMLKSHVDDIDKYINTFCFYIRGLLERASLDNLVAFIDRLMEEFELRGGRILFPSKVVTIFIAVMEGLLHRYELAGGAQSCDPGHLESLVSKVIMGLKRQGYLATFVDYLLDFDKKRGTSIYKEINSLRRT